jgi:YHS domain-containing protein
MDKTKPAKPSNGKRGTLFLQGVFKKDCKRMEDLFRDRLMYEYQEPKQTYKPLPPIFRNIDTWVRSTNLLCCFCARPFSSRPWFEPQAIESVCSGAVGSIECSEAKIEYNITTKYVFCSENCTAAFINRESKSLSEKNNKMAMLRFVYYLFNGVSITEIGASPDPTRMVQHGGYLTSSEYQQKINEIRNLSKQRKTIEDFSAVIDILDNIK